MGVWEDGRPVLGDRIRESLGLRGPRRVGVINRTLHQFGDRSSRVLCRGVVDGDSETFTTREVGLWEGTTG